MTTAEPNQPSPRGAWGTVFSPRGELTGAIVAGALLLTGAIAARVADAEHPATTLGVAFQWLSLVIGLVFGARAAGQALAARSVDIDVLMVVGAVLAAWMGAPGEGALLMVLFVLAGALEDLAMQRTTRAIEALHKLMPTQALRLRDGRWEPTPPESLVPGDRVRVLPGEAVPVDAVVADGGRTSINQASITGESMPREVREGDDLFAGTINVGNPIEAVVTRPAAQSSLQRILDLVTQAQQQREPVQRLIDRMSQPYAIGVFVAAGATALFFRFVVGAPWLGTESAEGLGGSAVYAAITLLIVASPCALIIATPTATLAAISRAARGGVLFKGGQAIERLARIGAIAFDKTGTLTIGRPRVMRIEPLDGADPARLLAVAAALEEHSTHPIATAIVELARSRGVAPADAADVGYTAGRGVHGLVAGGPARLGSLHHVRDVLSAGQAAAAETILGAVQHRGHIGVVCAWGAPEGVRAAVFILSDAARPGAECLVERLHEQGVAPVVMLTGDNAATARRVGEELGLDRVHAQLLPEQKVEHLQTLKSEVHARGDGRGVGVIGDGVNDAPALAAADAALAIGSIGSDAALESADVVMLSDDLSAVPWALTLARRARRTIAINLAFSLGAIMVMAAGVLAGPWLGFRLPLWMGVLGHEGGTLLVVGHSLLLLAYPSVELCTCDRSAHQHAEGHTPLTVGATAPAAA